MNLDVFEQFSPSLWSLTVVLFLPLAYFGYQRKFWRDGKKLQLGNALFGGLSALIGLLAIVKATSFLNSQPALIHLSLLHVLPPLVLLFIVAKDRGYRTSLRIAHGAGGATAPGGQQSLAYAPKPDRRTIKALNWDDIIISESLKLELMSVAELLKNPETTKGYGIEVPKGILLSGPPGTGKTTLAKVVANIAGLSFFVLSMDEIISQWVGESEKNLSLLFRAAERHAPSVIFIDEVDAIGRGRSSGQDAWAENLLNHLLQLIDGVVSTEGLYIIAATNRPDLVDPALKRSGRLNKVIEVGLPSPNARARMFQLYLSKLNISEDIDLAPLVQLTEGKSGADIKEICNQAGLNAFKRESLEGKRSYAVTKNDLALALHDHLAPTGTEG